MKINKLNIILVILISCFLLCGCGKQESSGLEGSISNPKKETIVSSGFDEKGSGTLQCSTDTVESDDMEVDLSYTITYERGNILKLRSVSKISSDDNTIVENYYNAYLNISSNYHELKYYDTSLTKEDNTVIYDVVINYEKIDADKLLKIEGKEDNIIVSGKAKLSLWLDLAEKFGTTCQEV